MKPVAEKKIIGESGLQRSFGTVNSQWECSADVEQSGWTPTAFRTESRYVLPDQPIESPLFKEKKFQLSSLRLRRRPCDGSTLRSNQAKQFEAANPGYFKYPYQFDKEGHGRFDDQVDLIFNLAHHDFFALDYLFPLSSIIQVVRSQEMAPFIARCWQFKSMTKALYKKSSLLMDDSAKTRMEGGCICYEPPEPELLKTMPINYLIFRSIVGHEIGHYWWRQFGDNRPEALQDIESQGQIEQVVSLFSIFLIMYKGYWERESLSEEQIREAIAFLEFETPAMAQNEDRIVKRLRKLKMPPRTFHPYKDLQIDPGKLVEKVCKLGDEAILAIRNEARDYAERALHLPLSSAAALINHRKIDNFITFKKVKADRYVRWRAFDRTARHLDSPVSPSQWREYQIHVPATNSLEPPVSHFLETARHIAEIRLFGDRFGTGLDFMKSEDVQRQCNAESRDQARLLALLLYQFEGNKKKRQFSPELARFLLMEDPSGLNDLLPDADYYFQWCTEDEQCPRASERFLAQAYSVANDTVHFDFWGQDGKNYQTTLPWEQFEEQGFSMESLKGHETFKLFGIEDGSAGWRMIPFPLD